MSPVSVPPWKIKVVEPIALREPASRLRALAEAGYNTFLLRSEDVFIDLLTDSGTSALSQEQRAAMEVGDEAYAGSRSFFRVEQAMQDVYGYRHLIPAHQGRGAEHLLARMLVRPGALVPSNLYFPTSRAHAELGGGVWGGEDRQPARQQEGQRMPHGMEPRAQEGVRLLSAVSCRLSARSFHGGPHGPDVALILIAGDDIEMTLPATSSS